MKVEIISEYGYLEAILGAGLSYGKTSAVSFLDVALDESLESDLYKIALRLANMGGSHSKFLEAISVWLDIRAPRYWWQEFDTYRVGTTKQSESTMHTILKSELTQGDFIRPIAMQILVRLNSLIEAKDFGQLKAELPEGFLQRRIVCLNYKAIAHIVAQRKRHKLKEWQVFIEEMKSLEYPEFIFTESGQALQELVFELVEARGYMSQGLSSEETMMRQVAKLQEELEELAFISVIPSWVYRKIQEASSQAKKTFDKPEEWKGCHLPDKNIDVFGQELADIGVVLFCMSEIYNQLRQAKGLPEFDLQKAVLKKAKSDVKRGVRNAD